MPLAPVLCLFGPENSVSHVVRLLSCLCRRAVLLGDVDFDGLTALPNNVGATLLINQRDLGRRVKRALIASNRRHFNIVRGRRNLNLFGAKAFSCADSTEERFGVEVSIPPAQVPISSLSDAEEAKLSHSFQSKLLRYRLAHYDSICAAKLEYAGLLPEMQETARAWLAPIIECPGLSQSILNHLVRRSEEMAGARFFEP